MEKSENLTSTTIGYYDDHAQDFWDGTRTHNVTQNYEALLGAIDAKPPFTLLDLGCGPGRDLAYFESLGHMAIGLDGSNQFAEMARRNSDAEVWVQNFIDLNLPAAYFDGVFANASLFHVPKNCILASLGAILATLRNGGVLFSSNPRPILKQCPIIILKFQCKNLLIAKIRFSSENISVAKPEYRREKQKHWESDKFWKQEEFEKSKQKPKSEEYFKRSKKID